MPSWAKLDWVDLVRVNSVSWTRSQTGLYTGMDADRSAGEGTQMWPIGQTGTKRTGGACCWKMEIAAGLMLSRVPIKRGEDRDWDGTGARWSLATDWPENGSKEGSWPLGMWESQVVNMTTTVTRKGLKPLIKKRGGYLSGRSRQREVVSAEKWYEWAAERNDEQNVVSDCDCRSAKASGGCGLIVHHEVVMVATVQWLEGGQRIVGGGPKWRRRKG